ncbi:MAG: hypothetical protein D6691_10370 [Candidatus Hydrogenedentota bacterium]|nr:MAG: hypothetical protein D6691_10370 [Candidatus Hydrogenedentota bacterium]
MGEEKESKKKTEAPGSERFEKLFTLSREGVRPPCFFAPFAGSRRESRLVEANANEISIQGDSSADLGSQSGGNCSPHACRKIACGKKGQLLRTPPRCNAYARELTLRIATNFSKEANS